MELGLITIAKNKSPGMLWGKDKETGKRPLLSKERYKEFEAFAYVPDEGYIVVDADGAVSKKAVDDALAKLKIKTFSYNTTNGAHYLFKLPKGDWFAKLGNSIRATIFPSKAKEYGVDLKGNYRGYAVLKKHGEMQRADLKDIEKGFENAPELPMIFTTTSPMKIHIEDFQAGSRDDTLFKWISKFRAKGFSKSNWCQFVMELCLITGYDGKNGDTPAEWRHWAEVKWGSSVQMGVPEDFTREEGEADWTKRALTWDRKTVYKTVLDENDKKKKVIDWQSAWMVKSILDYSTVGKKIIAETSMQISADDGQLWGYEEGDFKPIKDMKLIVSRWFIKKFKNVKPSVMTDMGKYLGGAIPVKKFLDEQFAVSFLNMTVNARFGTPIIINEDEMNQNLIPHNLISKEALTTTHKEAYEFLKTRMKQWTQNDKHLERQIFEMMGVSMTKYMGREKTYFLIGTGSNGKSWFLSLLYKMLGKQNVSNEDLKELSNDKFSSSNLYGKLANINFDISAEIIDDPSYFKKISSGDIISAAYKGVDKFTFGSYATNIFGANNIPYTREMGNSDAVNRRMEIIPFYSEFDKEKITPGEMIDMKEMLLSEKVIEVAILMSMMALQHAITSQFKLSDVSEAAFNEFKRDMNHMYDFIQKEGIRLGESVVSAYRRYKKWCAPYGHKTFGMNQFAKKYINAAKHHGVKLSKEQLGIKTIGNDVFQHIGDEDERD